jgi:glycosyltransferase involved in cell wall biosynthesis
MSERDKMHIGLVTRGDLAYTLDLANLLHEAGLSLTLYLPFEHVVREAGTREHPVERLYETNLLPAECQVRLITPPRMRNPWSLVTYSKLSNAMRADRIDAAHILAGPDELWLAVLANLLKDIPVIGTMIVPQPNVGGNIPASINQIINRLLALGSDLLIVNGSEQVEFVKKTYGVSQDQIGFIPLNTRVTAVRRLKQSQPEESGTVLFFGAARFHKGLEYLVKAQPIISKKLPSARIIISAHGEELQRCQQMIEDASKFEIYDGFASGEELAILFQRASLVVLPYLSASTSGVLMTAYSFGKPVVATNVGCLPEYVEHNQTGLLINPANSEELAEAIIYLLTNESARRRLGENALRWTDSINKGVVEQTIQTYEKAILRHAKPTLPQPEI